MRYGDDSSNKTQSLDPLLFAPADAKVRGPLAANGASIPCFDISLGGGNYNTAGGVKFGARVARVPSKRAPQAIKKIIDHYVANRSEGEEFVAFVDRVGAKSFDPLLDEFKEVGPVHQDIEMYMDWGKEELFEVIRGEGECSV